MANPNRDQGDRRGHGPHRRVTLSRGLKPEAQTNSDVKWREKIGVILTDYHRE